MIVRRMAVLAVALIGISAGTVVPTDAADPTFSAQPYCHLDQNQQVTESGLSVSFGGADGETFDVFVNDALQGEDRTPSARGSTSPPCPTASSTW